MDSPSRRLHGPPSASTSSNFFDEPFPTIPTNDFDQFSSDYTFPSWTPHAPRTTMRPPNGNANPSNSSNSSPVSSIDSSNQHRRHESSNSSRSAGLDPDPLLLDTAQNIRPKCIPARTQADPPKRPLDTTNAEEDLDRQMSELFDFESAANSPGGSVSTATSANKSIAGLAIPQYQESPRRAEVPIPKHYRPNLTTPPRPAVSTPASFQHETSWQHSTFQPQSFGFNGYPNTSFFSPMGGMTNGAGVAPNPGFVGPAYLSQPQPAFATPSAPFSGFSQPNQLPGTQLLIRPIPSKTRVETQILTTLTLLNPPPGVTKVHLPARTMAKSKLMAKSPPDRSPDMLELDVMPVCASAMKKPGVYARALALARGDEPSTHTRQQPQRSSSEGTTSDGNPKPSVEPMNGGPIKICDGCVIRERKRAGRRIEKEESAAEVNWKRCEKERIVVFNENEVVQWKLFGSAESKEPANKRAKGGARSKKKTENVGEMPTLSRPSSPLVPYCGKAKQTRLNMRITCYCRHQGEPEGFQGQFVAQEISSPILITDDHKTSSLQNDKTDATFKTEPRPFGERCFPSIPQIVPAIVPQQVGLGQSHSTTDLSNHNHFQTHPALYRSATSFALHQFSQLPTPQSTGVSTPLKYSSYRTSATLTPRHQSRQVSPSASSGPTPKRRKGSSAGLMNQHPSIDLSMTSMPVTNGGSAHTPRPSISPTPSSEASEGLAMATIGNTAQSAGPSTNAHASFAHPQHLSPNNISPSTDSDPMADVIPALQSNDQSPDPIQATSGDNLAAHANALHHSLARLPDATVSPVVAPRVLRVIPNEGPKAGGIDVTILGECFHPGLEVLFADASATSTAVVNPQTIVCRIPPSVEARVVLVTLKDQPQMEPQVRFRYVDTEESDLMRLALQVLHHRQTGRMVSATDIAHSIIDGQQLQHSQHVPQGFPPQQHFSSDVAGLETVILGVIDLIDQADEPIDPCYNARQQGGQTMLHLAASLGYHRLVAGLLARGANFDLRDRNGMSAMHMACLHGHMRVVRKLLSAGGDPTLRSLRGDTPIDMARHHPDVHGFISSIERHTRTVSVEATPHSHLSRSSSLASVHSKWATQLGAQTPAEEADMAFDVALAEAYRSRPVTPAQAWAGSRRNSASDKQRFSHQQPAGEAAANTHLVTAAAAMAAWGDNLAGQIQYFQQSVQRTLPQIQLPQLPPLPTFEAYQEHPMVRRISSLVPRKSAPSAPPAYDEIYPESSQTDLEIKKESVVRSFRETLMEEKRAAIFDHDIEPRSMIQALSGASSEEMRDELRNAHARNVKSLSKDRKLFFVWVCILYAFRHEDLC
ncbi:MAG: hypothetical protein Q9222_002840 [Ikaeria aurantiellina]